MKRRMNILSVIILILLISGVLRTFQISIIKGEYYKEAADSQRVAGTELEPERGNIFDRNMIPITNRSEVLVSYKMPNSSIYNIYTTKRYDEYSLAKHITGYIKEGNVGVTGVEKFYDDYLKALSNREIVVVKDAKNNPIKGFGYNITNSAEKPHNVKLTLDYKLQKICEDVFKNNGVSGAFVYQDSLTGDILAMGSYPDYEHGKIADYLDSDNAELLNKATSAYNLGSVFKIIVAACALEKGVDLEYNFYCDGKIDVSGQEFKCHTHNKGGHGIIGLKNAFAQSCNTYFIDLGIELGIIDLVEMGKDFGFGMKTGLFEQGIYESEGSLPDLNSYINDKAIANVSIGQGDIMATPLQITNAVTAVANGGILLKPNIVDSIIDNYGNVIKRVKNEKTERIIKESTASVLTELMQEVTLSGTAKEAVSSYGLSGICGKTGSAETGRYLDNEQIVHSWFSGFYEKDDSKYTLTVFLENGVTLSKSAAKVFAEIVSRSL